MRALQEQKHARRPVRHSMSDVSSGRGWLTGFGACPGIGRCDGILRILRFAERLRVCEEPLALRKIAGMLTRSFGVEDDGMAKGCFHQRNRPRWRPRPRCRWL